MVRHKSTAPGLQAAVNDELGGARQRERQWDGLDRRPDAQVRQALNVHHHSHLCGRQQQDKALVSKVVRKDHGYIVASK